ncbi:hypothetical protein [Cellulosimicrobium sp. Marseille-Q4280]|uniref:hypothetical protein n=1 Tax=Cellulosimicrobium sp. Marseille-Q4280 TaxID=2937992 RepID=UPI00204100F1|nr:hypothetical protein [Cellulosimicrobium sp. Marseille-Q4280]
MSIDTTPATPPRLRIKPVAVVSWVALIAALIWWANDTVGHGWPIVAVVVCGLAVLKAVDDAWTARTLRRHPRP